MMKKISEYRHFNIILHALAWSMVLFFPYFISDSDTRYQIGPLPGLYLTLSGSVHIILFYGNVLILYPKLLGKAYWLIYIICAFLLVALSVVAKSYILTWWFPDIQADARNHVVFPSMLVFVVSIFYSIAVDKIRAEKLRKENEATQLQMELQFLRSQISPHFLFNILTNLVALARKKSDHLETSLLMLSSLMRYMLYNSGKKISLRQEVEYLESYVALQKLRFGADVKIAFKADLPGEDTNFNIEPMLLIPFVENAFKHGTGYIDQPVINIDLTVREGRLAFEVKNKFDRDSGGGKDECSGIGLNNVRTRLTLLYPDRHDLLIQTENNLFHIYLKMSLL